MKKFGKWHKGQLDDPGFGAKNTQTRLVNNDGSFNVRIIGRLASNDTYHFLINVPWGHFLWIVTLTFFVANVLFASIYFMLGEGSLMGVVAKDETERFFEAFFFSTQTMTTLGYGRISPVGSMASLIAAVESLIGLLVFALATGLLYGRFSRPRSKIIFSPSILISPFQDKHAVMFRVANSKSSALIEVEATVLFSFIDPNDQDRIRKFYTLDLERKFISYLSLNWTLVHPLNDDSPIAAFSPADLKQCEAEVIVSVKAFDEVFSQTVYARKSYNAHDFVIGAKFTPMFYKDDERLTLDLDKINEFNKVEIQGELPILNEKLPAYAESR